MNRTVLSSLTIACLAPLATGQVLLQDGDPVPGFGEVAAFLDVAVNDAGSWAALVNARETGGTLRHAMFKDGAVFATYSDPVPLPPGASIERFGWPTVNAAGDSAWDITLLGTTGLDDNQAVYFGSTLVLREGDLTGAVGFSPLTRYGYMHATEFNDAGDALLLATMEDPGAATFTRALMRLVLDPAGNLLAEIALAKSGDAPAALLGDTIEDIDFAWRAFDGNAAGSVAYHALCTTTAGGRSAFFLDSTLVARTGDPSPVPGRDWDSNGGGLRSMRLNASGELLLRTNLTGDTATDDIMVFRDTAGTLSVVARQGDPIDTRDGTFAMDTLGRIALSDAGDILYYANWDDPDMTRDAGLVYNGRILVQEGKTVIAGNPVVSLTGPFELSPDGRTLVFACRFPGVVDALVMADVAELLRTFCDTTDGALVACPCLNPGGPASGCDNAQGTGGVALALVAQTSAPNGVTLAGTGFPAATSPAALVLRSNALDASSPVVFGDGLRCIATSPLVRLGATSAAGGTSLHAFGHGVGPGDFYYQVWYRNTPSTFCDPFAAFNLSNGVRLAW